MGAPLSRRGSGEKGAERRGAARRTGAGRAGPGGGSAPLPRGRTMTLEELPGDQRTAGR